MTVNIKGPYNRQPKRIHLTVNLNIPDDFSIQIAKPYATYLKSLTATLCYPKHAKIYHFIL